MNDTPKTEETKDAKLARLRRERIERETKRAEETSVDRAIEREELIAKHEAILGPRGDAFEIHDTGHGGDPFVVVKRPAMIQWTKYDQSKMTPTDRYDFVAPSIVHPSIDEYNALRDKRAGIDVPISNLLGTLMGLVKAEDAGK